MTPGSDCFVLLDHPQTTKKGIKMLDLNGFYSEMRVYFTCLRASFDKKMMFFGCSLIYRL